MRSFICSSTNSTRYAVVFSRMATRPCAGLRPSSSQQGAWLVTISANTEAGLQAASTVTVSHAGDFGRAGCVLCRPLAEPRVSASDRFPTWLIGTLQGDNRPPQRRIELTAMKFLSIQWSPGRTLGLSGCNRRFSADPAIWIARAKNRRRRFDAEEAEASALVHLPRSMISTGRRGAGVFFEDRTSFSPDGLTGMSERCAGLPGNHGIENLLALDRPENWIFNAPTRRRRWRATSLQHRPEVAVLYDAF